MSSFASPSPLATPPLHSFSVRPNFLHRVNAGPAEVRARLLQAFAAEPSRYEVHDFERFIGVHIADPERRFWSPRLLLVLEADNGGTRLQGTYGPEMEIWSVFLYGYLITGLLGTFSAMLGFAQVLTGAHAWGFWVVGAMALIALVLYIGAQFGQKLGAWQTFQVHQTYLAAAGVEASESVESTATVPAASS